MLTFISYVQTFLTRNLRREDDRGATAVEYGLMVGLIAVVIIATVMALGLRLDELFAEVEAQLDAV
ncbi:Flp family type IVb pilin [Lentzea terrae]|jgi:pilus assembly protein Flp/PilA|uniref:Flp family type IVb pilin n=1 Tax=Lentzea terrae TaxID=2200761 RepID=UPI000DD3457E|nr:Flp family type IVb pilin [Lentzea terrae]